MSNDKNLGANVTYLDPSKKAFDRVVFKQEKPLSHAELGLLQDLGSEARSEVVRKMLPSGFLTGDFFEYGNSDYNFTPEPNRFELNNNPVANVNGWLIPLELTGTDQVGSNVIELDGPHTVTGEFRIDFVYLEVWKALIDPAPSMTNKPPFIRVVGTETETFDLDGQTFTFTIDSATSQVISVTFAANGLSATDVVTEINNEIAASPLNVGHPEDGLDAEAFVSNGQVGLRSNDLLDIGTGTANGTIGFEAGVVGNIFPSGNVLSDESTWLLDDLASAPIHDHIDETTRRVQIQYAIRSARLDSTTQRIGYNDINVLAQGATSGPQPTYSFTKSSSDPGLWVAGDGEPQNDLNTVDGFVYSIPIAWVYRRNSEGFGLDSNGHGAVAGVDEPLTNSDRPDGLYADQVAFQDLQDLRMASLRGGDYHRVLERNAALLMDNKLSSWMQNGDDAGWVVANNFAVGTKVLMADDLVDNPLASNYGNPFRSPDGICTVFSDRAHLELHVEVREPTAHVDWSGYFTNDEPIVFDLDENSRLNDMPDGVAIVDVLSVKFNGWDSGESAQAEVPVSHINLLNNNTRVEIYLDSDPVGFTTNDIWIEAEIEYPIGEGLTALVDEEAPNWKVVGHDFSTIWGPQGYADQDDLRDHLDITFTEGPQREVTILQQTASPITENTELFFEGATPYVLTTKLIHDVVEVTVGGVTATVDSVDGRRINLVDNAYSGGDSVSIEYTPLQPIQRQNNLTLYYLTPALQAVSAGNLSTTLTVELLEVPSKLYTVTASSGSDVTPFPYEAASNQIPVSFSIQGTPAYMGEHELSSPTPTSVNGFDASVGQLQLNTFVPMVPVDEITLSTPESKDPQDKGHPVDSYQSVVDDYQPSAFAQSLSSGVEHKAFMPVLARLKEDTSWAPEGTMVMIVFTQYFNSASELPDSEQNSFSMSSDNACAAIYKVKGNVLSYN